MVGEDAAERTLPPERVWVWADAAVTGGQWELSVIGPVIDTDEPSYEYVRADVATPPEPPSVAAARARLEDAFGSAVDALDLEGAMDHPQEAKRIFRDDLASYAAAVATEERRSGRTTDGEGEG